MLHDDLLFGIKIAADAVCDFDCNFGWFKSNSNFHFQGISCLIDQALDALDEGQLNKERADLLERLGQFQLVPAGVDPGSPGRHNGYIKKEGKETMSGLFAFFGGRKSSLSIIAIICVAALAGFERISVERFIELLPWLVGIGAGSIALEDGLRHLGNKK